MSDYESVLEELKITGEELFEMNNIIRRPTNTTSCTSVEWSYRELTNDINHVIEQNNSEQKEDSSTCISSKSINGKLDKDSSNVQIWDQTAKRQNTQLFNEKFQDLALGGKKKSTFNQNESKTPKGGQTVS